MNPPEDTAESAFRRRIASSYLYTSKDNDRNRVINRAYALALNEGIAIDVLRDIHQQVMDVLGIPNPE